MLASSSLSLLAKATTVLTRQKDEVYVAAVPLRATKGPAQLLMSTAYNLRIWDLQHFMVIIKPNSPPPADASQAIVFDFQPKEPENVYTAIAALTGRPVPAVVLVRKLMRLPRRKCWFVGSSKFDAVDVATKFSNNWGTDLRVGQHDCRDYTNALETRIFIQLFLERFSLPPTMTVCLGRLILTGYTLIALVFSASYSFVVFQEQ